jgi:hypothetical protein
MILVRWLVAIIVVAIACGCSSSKPGGPSSDAGRDGRAASDARPADAYRLDAHPADGHRVDGRPADGSFADAGPGDARAADARSVDARPGDAATHDADVGAPTETMISISPPPLHPSFATTTHDYYVRCDAGTNSLSVSMTAAPGSTIAMQQPTTTPASTDTTATISVTENQAIVVGVTTGGTTDPYWIRCLPHDFPTLQMTQHPDAGAPTPGYYLMGDFFPATAKGTYAMMVDGNGVPVWYRATTGGLGAVNVDSLEAGMVSFVPYIITTTFADASGQYQVLDLDAGTTTTVASSGMPLDMHELRYLPNGDYLVIAAPITTGVDLTGLCDTLTDPPTCFGTNEDMIECDIQEISPTGEAVWQWDASDHFDPVKDSTWPLTEMVDGKAVVDVYHCNSIDVDPDGNLLVSARHMDSVFLISRPSGTVLWKMGGASYSTDDAPYIAVHNDPLTSFYRQHDARLLPNGEVSMFDDQTDLASTARGVIYSYDVDAGTASMVWQYKGSDIALSMGSFRVQPDGRRVIGWGVGEKTLSVFSEVDENGNDLLDFSFPNGEVSYRAVKVPTTAFDINVLRATAGRTVSGPDSGT